MKLPGRIIAVMAALTGLATAFSPGAANADDTAGGRVTYAEDVAPILNNNCVTCHRPGQIAPMSLLSFQDARPWAKSIRTAVSDKTMPPWHADPAYGHFLNARMLTDAQIRTIEEWVDQGAQPGDLSKAPEPTIDTSTEWAIGTPDQIFEMPKYEVADDVEDLYMHFLVPADFPEDRDITEMEIHAGNPALVHHVLVFALPASMGAKSIFEDPNTAMRSDFITGWAPGTDPLKYGPGYAKRLKAHNNLLFQLHFHKTPGPGTGGWDQSKLAVKFADKPVENPTMTAWIMNLELLIPPGDPNYVSTSQFEFKSDGYILGYTPHMHLRGKEASYTAYYPDGKQEILLHVPRYDFNWQTFYTLAEPKFVPKGTIVKSVQRYDNSANNPANPDPTQEVHFSEATTDEMHIGFMEYAYVDKNVIAQKYGFPEGFNIYEFRQKNQARYEARAQQEREAMKAFQEKQQQSGQAPEFVPADAAGAPTAGGI